MRDDIRKLNMTARHDREDSFNDEWVKQSTNLFTMFRNPTHHIVSQWKHCKETKDNAGNGCVKTGQKYFQWTSFRMWASYWAQVAREFNGSFESFNADHYSLRLLRNCELPLNPFPCHYIPVNLQSTRLGVFNETNIDERIDQMFHVGVTDMYSASLCVLHFNVHHFTSPQCGCNGKFSENHIRHGVAQYDPQEVARTADPHDISRLTDLDVIIYEKAKQRLTWEIEYIQNQFDGTFLCPSKSDEEEK